ncbi:MAG: hypothetical protein JXR91_15275 [Deltaproteobacteria bacterium]|nr:hypothetical protein [Deltaproteobacteria bacterium]
MIYTKRKDHHRIFIVLILAFALIETACAGGTTSPKATQGTLLTNDTKTAPDDNAEIRIGLKNYSPVLLSGSSIKTGGLMSMCLINQSQDVGIDYWDYQMRVLYMEIGKERDVKDSLIPCRGDGETIILGPGDEDCYWFDFRDFSPMRNRAFFELEDGCYSTVLVLGEDATRIPIELCYQNNEHKNTSNPKYNTRFRPRPGCLNSEKTTPEQNKIKH